MYNQVGEDGAVEGLVVNYQDTLSMVDRRPQEVGQALLSLEVVVVR